MTTGHQNEHTQLLTLQVFPVHDGHIGWAPAARGGPDLADHPADSVFQPGWAPSTLFRK